MVAIGFVGDVHSEWEVVKKIEKEVDLIMCVGDLQTYPPLNKPFYFILGNHESDLYLEELRYKNLKIPNLNHVKTGEVYEVAGLRVSGLNGNYSPNWKERPRHFTKDDLKKCMKLRKIDVFLSHEAPKGIGLKAKDSDDAGVSEIRTLVEKIQSRYFFSGHHHFYLEAVIGKTRVFSLPRPSAGYVKFDTETGKIELVKFI